MKMNVTATVSHALGHWPRILPALGIQVLKNRHQPCPVCGGSDRFRFDDREGRGTWYCNQCGAGDGLKLVEKVFGVSPSDAAAKVAAVTGSLPPADPAVTAAAVAETEAARKNAAALAQTLMAKTRPGTGNAYLTRKGFPGRECRMLTGTHRAGGVSWRAGDLVVPLYDDSGELVNLQLISADGRKRTLKGGQVRGTCHTLEGQNQAGKRLWIAEGYATALTVHHLTGETVMVALSSGRSIRPVRLSLPQTVTSAVTARKKPPQPQMRVRALLPCRRSSVTGMMPSRSTAGRPPVRPFTMLSGHRLKARSTP